MKVTSYIEQTLKKNLYTNLDREYSSVTCNCENPFFKVLGLFLISSAFLFSLVLVWDNDILRPVENVAAGILLTFYALKTSLSNISFSGIFFPQAVSFC